MSKSNEAEHFDPVRTWREWYQKSEKSWSDMVTQLLGDEKVSKSTGKYLQEAMHMQRMFLDSMARGLANLNLPARSDILSLSERLGKIEDAIAGVQVELRQLRRALSERELSAAEEIRRVAPKRTKKPPTRD
ncbi:MAG: hypothetical protein AB7G75_00775 [Candidatus Binatia bacterium]